MATTGAGSEKSLEAVPCDESLGRTPAGVNGVSGTPLGLRHSRTKNPYSLSRDSTFLAVGDAVLRPRIAGCGGTLYRGGRGGNRNAGSEWAARVRDDVWPDPARRRGGAESVRDFGNRPRSR